MLRHTGNITDWIDCWHLLEEMVRPCNCPWMTGEEGLLVPAHGEQLGEGEWGDNLGRQFIRYSLWIAGKRGEGQKGDN